MLSFGICCNTRVAVLDITKNETRDMTMTALYVTMKPSLYVKVSKGEMGGEREGERERKRDRQTDRQTETQTDRQTDGRTDGRTDRQTDRQTDLKKERETDTQLE